MRRKIMTRLIAACGLLMMTVSAQAALIQWSFSGVIQLAGGNDSLGLDGKSYFVDVLIDDQATWEIASFDSNYMVLSATSGTISIPGVSNVITSTSTPAMVWTPTNSGSTYFSRASDNGSALSPIIDGTPLIMGINPGNSNLAMPNSGDVFSVTQLPGEAFISMLTPGATAVYDITNRSVTVSSVPLPAAAWLFGSGLISLVGLTRRKQIAE